MTSEGPYLLPSVKRAVTHWTFTDYPNGTGSRTLADGHGEIAIAAPLTPPERRYAHPTRGTARAIVTAKRGPYTPPGSTTAYGSFMPRVLAWALNREDVLIQCYGSGEPAYRVEDCWVFDARRVANQASERTRTIQTVDSKQAREVTVFDASRVAHGVPLGDWLSRQATVPAPETDGLRPTTLRRFGIEGVQA